MVKLKEYWYQEKELVKTTKKKSFLNNYSKGEMNLFEDYIEKMISSKSAEIFRQAQIKRDDPDASEESSYKDSNEEDTLDD